MTEQRTVCMLTFRAQSTVHWHGFVCRPCDPEPAEPCAKLNPTHASRLDLKVGDWVKMRRRDGKRTSWIQRQIWEITLTTVRPGLYDGRLVTCGRDWLEGREDGIVEERRKKT